MSSNEEKFPYTFEFLDLFDTSDLKPSVRLHFFKVYSDLAMVLFSFGFGVYTCLLSGYSGAEPVVIGGLIMCLLKLLNQASSQIQYILLLSFGYFEGISLGLLSGSIIKLAPSIFIASYVTVFCVILSFSLSALYIPKKQVLYLCATITSWVLIEVCMQVLNAYLKWDMLGIIRPGLGLYASIGYTIYGSQYILSQFQNGDSYHIQHALVLFIDILSIFVRIISSITRLIRRINEKNILSDIQ